MCLAVYSVYITPQTDLSVLISLHHPLSHFRCEVANLTEGCDNVTMTEFVANTAIDADGETVCSDKSFVMTDWNWLDLEPFQPNVACAYYLPPVEGCCWDVWLLKDFDPIVCGDNCQCDCEDNVHFEEGELSTKTYCDSDGGAPHAGWCWPPVGPHNVHGTVPFFTGKSGNEPSLNTECSKSGDIPPSKHTLKLQ